MEKSVSSDYATFISQLQAYCKNNESGCMFITCNNRSGRIILKDGLITNLAYAKYHGIDAIKEINSIDNIVYRFARINTNFKPDTSLPDTHSVLSELGVAYPEVSSRSATQHTSNISKKEVEESLIEVIGPMGEFLCEEHLSDARDISVAITNICNELSMGEKESFIKQLEVIGYR